MSRIQKLFSLYNLEDFQRHEQTGEEIMAVAVTYAKDLRGAIRTFEQGRHTGFYMLKWDTGKKVISL